MPEPIRFNGAQVDLGPRLFFTNTVANSPALAAETIIATLTITADVALQKGIVLIGFGTFTQGTDGTTVVMRIRRTDASGTIVKATGAMPFATTVLGNINISGVDTGITPLNQVYVLTATHANASAASTYTAATLTAIVV
jgi:hypothetical protein